MNNLLQETEKMVIVYDGQCSFCRRQIQRIRQMDQHQIFECLPRETPETSERFPILKGSDFNQGMRLITPSGEVFVGADAIYQIAIRLPQAKWIAWLYRMPVCKQVARLIYRWIADNRMRLSHYCSDETCKLS